MYHLVTLFSTYHLWWRIQHSSHKSIREQCLLLMVSQVEETQEFTLYISYDASKNSHFPFACLFHWPLADTSSPVGFFCLFFLFSLCFSRCHFVYIWIISGTPNLSFTLLNTVVKTSSVLFPFLRHLNVVFQDVKFYSTFTSRSLLYFFLKKKKGFSFCPWLKSTKGTQTHSHTGW